MLEFLKIYFVRAWSQTLGTADLWSSIAGAVIAVVAHFFPQSEEALTALTWQVPVWALALVAATRFSMTPYWLWKEQRAEIHAANERIARLEESIRPKLKCTFGQKVPGCVVRTSFTGTQITADYYRLKVETDQIGHVPSCTGRLTSLTFGGNNILAGETPILTFAPGHAADAIAKNIHDMVPEFLDVLAIAEDRPPLLTLRGFQFPNSINPSTLFARYGLYNFTIAVTSPSSGTVTVKLELDWQGDRRTVRMRELP